MELAAKHAEAEATATTKKSRQQNTPSKQPLEPLKEDPVAIGQKFEPVDLEKQSPEIGSGLPTELWTIVQSAPATFPPIFFIDVMDNLLRNPNLTSSHLFRAEIFYDSEKDATFNSTATLPEHLSPFIRHMKAEYKPRIIAGGYPDYALVRTVVRKLIPRNPKLDKPLVQTCHLFTSRKEFAILDGAGVEMMQEQERYLIIYVPHVSDMTEIPWYHPPVQELAIFYKWKQPSMSDAPSGIMALFYQLFPRTTVDTRLSRIALNMLRIIHKHSTGRMGGYTKRVHHDVIVPQKIFQDTYSFLKGKYAEILIRDWIEQTPATKHVFEDLGIAAFLIELWTDMYGGGPRAEEGVEWSRELTETENAEQYRRRARAQRKFPGFVDIGCGNGLLVYILRQEGWSGWGFDARKRRTWDTYPREVKENLKVRLLVPGVLGTDEMEAPDGSPPEVDSSTLSSFPISFDSHINHSIYSDDHHNSPLDSTESLDSPEVRSDRPVSVHCMTSGISSPKLDAQQQSLEDPQPRDLPNLDGSGSIVAQSHPNTQGHHDPSVVCTHNGIFPQGTFLVANHADELTIWTPLLAYLSQSPFIVIPCCSHNFAGARFRAPPAVQFKMPDTTERRKLLKYFTATSEGMMSPFKAVLRTVSTPSPAPLQVDGSNESKLGRTSSNISLNTAQNDTLSCFNSDGLIDTRTSCHDVIPLTKFCPSDDPTSHTSSSSKKQKKPKYKKRKEDPPHADDHPPNLLEPEISPESSTTSTTPSTLFSGASPVTPKSTAASSATKSSKQPSSYASFCSYLTSLTSALGYVPEKEILRIPSTRNVAILGREFADPEVGEKLGLEGRIAVVKAVVEKEIGAGIENIRSDWMGRGETLKKPGKGAGH